MEKLGKGKITTVTVDLTSNSHKALFTKHTTRYKDINEKAIIEKAKERFDNSIISREYDWDNKIEGSCDVFYNPIYSKYFH